MHELIAQVEEHPDTLTAVVVEDPDRGVMAAVEDAPDTLTAVVEDC
jgi:hypothetical protein